MDTMPMNAQQPSITQINMNTMKINIKKISVITAKSPGTGLQVAGKGKVTKEGSPKLRQIFAITVIHQVIEFQIVGKNKEMKEYNMSRVRVRIDAITVIKSDIGWIVVIRNKRIRESSKEIEAIEETTIQAEEIIIIELIHIKYYFN